MSRSPSLDLLRILAATLVLIHHLAGLKWGWVGVQLFFTLSGYLIAASMHGSSKSFIRSRCRRLLPGSIACALVTTGVLGLCGQLPATWGWDLIRSMTISPFGPWIDGVYWTLGIELAFYALVAILITLRGHKHLETIVVAIGLLSLSTWLLALSAGQYGPSVAGQPRMAQILLLKDATFFAAGVILWRGVSEGWTTKRLVCLIATAVAGSIPMSAEALVRNGEVSLLAISIWWSSLAIIPLTARWGSSGPALSLLSRATYPLYLIHNAAGLAIIGVTGTTWTPVVIAGAVGTALIITTWIEPGILGAFNRIAHIIPNRRLTGRIEKGLTTGFRKLS